MVKNTGFYEKCWYYFVKYCLKWVKKVGYLTIVTNVLPLIVNGIKINFVTAKSY